MDPFIVVTHPVPLRIEARPVEIDAAAQEHTALAFFVDDRMIARGAVPPSAIEPLRHLLSQPVTLAIAAVQDDGGNIDGRVCIVLPLPPGQTDETGDEPEEPWKSSVPNLPPGIEASEQAQPVKLALLPLGNVVRSAKNRRHSDVADDAREMLDNLLAGRAQDAVNRAIDDLLDSI
jgi:hypothetical protein